MLQLKDILTKEEFISIKNDFFEGEKENILNEGWLTNEKFLLEAEKFKKLSKEEKSKYAESEALKFSDYMMLNTHPYTYINDYGPEIVDDAYTKYLKNMTFGKAFDYLTDLPFDEDEENILISSEPFLNLDKGMTQEDIWSEMEQRFFGIIMGKALHDSDYVEINKDMKYKLYF